MNVIGLFVGINYEGSGSDLSGCLNDAEDYSETFGEHCNGGCQMLLEADATKNAMLSALELKVKELKFGDLLMFTFSGHGTWMPDASGDEPDGKDECLCPFDFQENLLVDDELSKIFNSRKRGSKILFLSDSCHSGTVFRMAGSPEQQGNYKRIRFIPPDRIECLSERVLAKAEKAGDKILQERLIRKDNAPQSGIIHFSGCQDTEYSYDAYFNGRYNGAFTRNFLDVYNELDDGSTYNHLYEQLKMRLPSFDYPQRPRLNAVGADKKKVLIGR